MKAKHIILLVAAAPLLFAACKKEEQKPKSKVLPVASVEEEEEPSASDEMMHELDSLRMENDQLQLAKLEESVAQLPKFKDPEGLKLNDSQRSLLNKYNEARNKIDGLMAEIRELRTNRTSENNNAEELKKREEKIKALEAEIATLKDVARSLYEQLADLNLKYENEVKKNTELASSNEALRSEVTQTRTNNEQLQEKIAVAERLNVTGINLAAFNKKGKNEKKVSKASQLGVSFKIAPNNTAAPGMKDVFVRIKSPEGSLLPGAGSFTFDGTSVPYTTKRSIEYANEELPVDVYWDVTSSLTPGEYTVEIFCDGNRLATRKFNLN